MTLAHSFDALQAKDDNLLCEKASHLDQLEKASAYDVLLVKNQQLMDELKPLKKAHDDDKKFSVERAVREYHESKDYFYRKVAYGSGFYKLGFYAARHLLEDISGDAFPWMTLSPHLENEDCPHWCRYIRRRPLQSSHIWINLLAMILTTFLVHRSFMVFMVFALSALREVT